MKYIRAAFFALLLPACYESSRPSVPPHQQALVVLTDGWDSLRAVVTAIEWTDNGWSIRQSHPAVVGQRGLGWGIGVTDFTSREGPVKVEGDQKSPAGIFRIGPAFGKYPADSLADLLITYQQIDPQLQCIEDQNSAKYNQLVMDNDPKKDWEQDDYMLREDDLYDLGAFVNHNSNPAIAGAGSCIFLHLWRAPSMGTLGCTAMNKLDLLSHLIWLDPEKDPILVQMPRSIYPTIAAQYALPPEI